jgi:hypothetical protein
MLSIIISYVYVVITRKFFFCVLFLLYHIRVIAIKIFTLFSIYVYVHHFSSFFNKKVGLFYRYAFDIYILYLV